MRVNFDYGIVLSNRMFGEIHPAAPMLFLRQTDINKVLLV